MLGTTEGIIPHVTFDVTHEQAIRTRH